MDKRIFTFWEPKNKMPGYIQLCLKTWKKFLPDYNIVVLDYHNLKNYLTPKEIHQFLYKKFPLQQQSDALRTILLEKYGGIWLDADTILTSADIFKIKNGSCVMIGNESCLHLAFIQASKGGVFIKKWADNVRRRIQDYRRFSRLLFFKKLFKEKRRKFKDWDYLGNGIIDPLRQSLSANELFVINKDEIGALPEKFYSSEKNSPMDQYRNFYFSKTNISLDDVLNKIQGIILLHNSWTPTEFKNMSQSEFLKQDILMADLFKKILENN